MKYLVLFFLLLIFIQCSDADIEDNTGHELIGIDIKTVGNDSIQKSVFQEDERVTFIVMITNHSSKHVVWDLPDGNWNNFTIRNENEDTYDWPGHNNRICLLRGWFPVELEPGATVEFEMTGRGDCHNPILIISKHPPQGTYTFMHSGDYIFTYKGGTQPFEVSAKISKDFEVR